MEEKDEVTRLKEELQKSAEKLEVWKDKAKKGVDELRQRVLVLTEQLEKSEKQRLLLEGEANSVALPIGDASKAQDFFEFATLEMLTTVDQKLDESLSFVNVLLLNSRTDYLADFERYKRRSETTLRLQIKNCEALQEQLNTAQESIEEKQNMIKHKEAAIAQRDETLGVLSSKVEQLERYKASSEAQQSIGFQQPNMEELSSMEARLEAETRRISSEFSLRESVVFQQHQDEIRRLVHNHEKEMEKLRAECEQKILSATEDLEHKMTLGMASQQGREDTAYHILLEEKKCLEDERRDLLSRVDTLEAKLAMMKVETNHVNAPPQVAWNEADVKGNDGESAMSRNQLMEKINSLHNTISSLSTKLCKLKNENEALKIHEKEKNPKENALSVQQVDYLKSILIQMLSHRHDDRIFSHTLPVVSTILSLSPEEISEMKKTL